MGLLPDTQNCGLRMRRECRERFPRHRRSAIPTCITARAWHVPWCMPGSLTSGFLKSRSRENRSRHSERMRIPQFCVSGKRPIRNIFKYHLVTLRWCRQLKYFLKEKTVPLILHSRHSSFCGIFYSTFDILRYITQKLFLQLCLVGLEIRS